MAGQTASFTFLEIDYNVYRSNGIFVTKLLAIETTEKRGSVVIALDGKLLQYNELPNGQRSAQSLVPTIQAALKQVDWPIKSLDVVAVAIGPGSFTGLRVGLATARMLAYAVDAKLIGINTLQAIAANACIAGTVIEGQIITTAVDAQRGEVSAQTFRLMPSRYFVREFHPEPIDECRLLTFATWWELANMDTTICFAGPILQKISFGRAGTPDGKSCGSARKPENVQLLDESLWKPSAAGVSRLAWERLQSGESDSLLTLQPYYSRPSAAEEKKLTP